MEISKLKFIKIMEVICSYTGGDVESSLGKSRRGREVLSRQICMFCLHELTPMSLNEIGSLFTRDHATVIHSSKAIQQAISIDQNPQTYGRGFKNDIISLTSKVKNVLHSRDTWKRYRASRGILLERGRRVNHT